MLYTYPGLEGLFKQEAVLFLGLGQLGTINILVEDYDAEESLRSVFVVQLTRVES